MLRNNNENEILKCFESMLRKKMQKNMKQTSIQQLGFVSKSIVGLYGNKYDSREGTNTKQSNIKSNTVRSSNLNAIDANKEEKVGATENSFNHKQIENQLQYM